MTVSAIWQSWHAECTSVIATVHSCCPLLLLAVRLGPAAASAWFALGSHALISACTWMYCVTYMRCTRESMACMLPASSRGRCSSRFKMSIQQPLHNIRANIMSTKVAWSLLF
jgi:hypothetical protein